MDKRLPVPDGFKPDTSVLIRGVLAAQAQADFCEGMREKVCRAILQVGDEDYAIVARKELATQLGECRAGSGMKTHGRLVRHEWKTGDGEQHDRVVVELTSVEVIAEVRRVPR